MHTPHPKHRNQVRIIGGSLRGRKLTFAQADGLRPTADSVRERLFNWLGQDLSGQNVLDLFAGSGALGFEAASRHAARVTLCEIHRNTFRNLQRNAQDLGLSGSLNICNQDAAGFLRSSSERFHTVFLDPPFAWQQWAELFAVLPDRLHPQAAVYIEAGSLPSLPDWLHIYRQGRAGQSCFVLLHHAQHID